MLLKILPSWGMEPLALGSEDGRGTTVPKIHVLSGQKVKSSDSFITKVNCDVNFPF